MAQTPSPLNQPIVGMAWRTWRGVDGERGSQDGHQKSRVLVLLMAGLSCVTVDRSSHFIFYGRGGLTNDVRAEQPCWEVKRLWDPRRYGAGVEGRRGNGQRLRRTTCRWFDFGNSLSSAPISHPVCQRMLWFSHQSACHSLGVKEASSGLQGPVGRHRWPWEAAQFCLSVGPSTCPSSTC